MINKLKEYLFQKFLKKQQQPSSPFVFEEMHRVAILLDDTTEKEHIHTVLKQLLGKKVKIDFFHFEKYDKKKPVLLEVYTDKDFNWYKKPIKGELLNYMDNAYDLLVDFSEEYNPFTHDVILLGKAKIKAGRKAGEVYNFVLFSDDKVFFMEELLRYLITFKK